MRDKMYFMSRRFIFLSSLIILGITSIRSQDYIKYYNLRNEAVHHYLSDHLEKSEELLSEAIVEADPLGKDLYLLAIIKAKLGNKKEAEKHLKLAIAKEGVPSSWLIEDAQIFRTVFDSIQYDSVLNFVNVQWEYIEFEFSHNPFNIKLEYWVDSLIKQDQKYRSLVNPEDYMPGILDSLRTLSDLQTQYRLMQHVKDHGWPKRSSELLTTILLHFTRENYNKYKDNILEEVRAGRLDPYWYASMVDRLESLIYDNPCTYGIWGDCEAYADLIFHNRLEIGLSPYWNGPYRIYKRLN